MNTNPTDTAGAELEALADQLDETLGGSGADNAVLESVQRSLRELALRLTAPQPGAAVPEGMSLLVDALEGAMIESLHGEGFDLWAKNRGKLRNRLPENVGAIVVKMRALLAAAPAPEAAKPYFIAPEHASKRRDHNGRGGDGLKDGFTRRPAPEAEKAKGEAVCRDYPNCPNLVCYACEAAGKPLHPAPPAAGQPENDALNRILQFGGELNARDERVAMAAWDREYAELMARKPEGVSGQPEDVDIEELAQWCDEQSKDPDNADGAVTLLVIAQTLRRIASAPQSAAPLAREYEASHDLAVTEEWRIGWDACRTFASQMVPQSAGSEQQGDVYEAYKTWPDDIRAKLSLHDLRRMSGWVPRKTVGCYCKPGRCMAPKIMGHQTACRDPEKAARDAGNGEGVGDG